MAENQNAADQASTLNDERATRLAKRAALFEAGQNPYPEHSELEDYVADIEAKYAELADGVAAERGIRLLADVVLHLAGILHCDLCRNPKSLQHPGKNNVTLINLIGDLCPLLQKCHGTVTVHSNITILTKKLHCVTDAWLGNTKSGRNINRTDSSAFFG